MQVTSSEASSNQFSDDTRPTQTENIWQCVISHLVLSKANLRHWKKTTSDLNWFLHPTTTLQCQHRRVDMSVGRISTSRKNKLCRTEICVSCRLIAAYDDCLHQDNSTWSRLLRVVLKLFIRFFYDHHKDFGQQVVFFRDRAPV